jgi:serine/threonine protein kinase
MDEKALTTEAIRRGYLTFDQMLECHKLQEASRKAGLDLTLADILLKKGFLDRAQIAEITGQPVPGDTDMTRPLDPGGLFDPGPDLSGPETPEPEPAPITMKFDIDSLLARRQKEIDAKATESGWTDLPAAIGPYEVLQKLGEGEMGAVYRVRKPGDERDMVLRVWPAGFLQDPSLSGRFRAEAQARVSLSSTHLVRIFECATIEDRFASVCEFVEGRPLWEYVEERGALPEKDVLRFAIQMAEALSAVHRAGLIHRNLKPDRVIIDAEGDACVLEPGIKKRGVSATGLPYMAPEVNRAEPAIDARADLYSLGATLFYAATGHHPFAAPSPQEALKKQLEGDVPDPRRYRGSLSPGTALLLRRLMSKNPAERPGSVEEIVPELKRLLQEAPLHRVEDPREPSKLPADIRLQTDPGVTPIHLPPVASRRRNLLVWGLTALLILVLLALLLLK